MRHTRAWDGSIGSGSGWASSEPFGKNPSLSVGRHWCDAGWELLLLTRTEGERRDRRAEVFLSIPPFAATSLGSRSGAAWRVCRKAGIADIHPVGDDRGSSGGGDLLHDCAGSIANGNRHLRLIILVRPPILAHLRIAVDGLEAEKGPSGVRTQSGGGEMDTPFPGRFQRATPSPWLTRPRTGSTAVGESANVAVPSG